MNDNYKDTRPIFYPIIYLRGFAMSQGERDETSTDPFAGFNIGSTIYRANPNKSDPPRKYVFESPVIRLMTDFGYQDIFDDGKDIIDDGFDFQMKSKSIIICNYYAESSRQFGNADVPTVPQAAEKLNNLILNVKRRIVNGPDQVLPDNFRCYLVAHSMGGLVCRALIQNRNIGSDEARKSIAKVFTYGTPHNGIDFDLGLFGGSVNVPRWLNVSDIANFNRRNMASYLDVENYEAYLKDDRVDILPESIFPSQNFFCMVGTNRLDYEVALGLSRAFVGDGSDGLVRIENATLKGINDKGKEVAVSPRAYSYRAHSGHFGLVNSVETYQNLVRFLFGDIRVDACLVIDEVTLPDEIEQAKREGKSIEATYQIEFKAGSRGKVWLLTRRTAEEDSVALRNHEELRSDPEVYLSTIYLANKWKVDQSRDSLAFQAFLGIRVPDYTVERKFMPDKHFEERYLFRKDVVVEVTPPKVEGDGYKVVYNWHYDNPNTVVVTTIQPMRDGNMLELKVPFGETSDFNPRVKGYLSFRISPWNVINE